MSNGSSIWADRARRWRRSFGSRPAFSRPRARTFSPFRASDRMRFQPVERKQAEPVGDARRSSSSATRSIRSPSRIWSSGSRCAKSSLIPSSLRKARRGSVSASRCHRVAAAPIRCRRAASGLGRLVAIEAEPDLVRPAPLRSAQRRASVDPAGERADQVAHLLAERRVAEAHLAHLRVERSRPSSRSARPVACAPLRRPPPAGRWSARRSSQAPRIGRRSCPGPRLRRTRRAAAPRRPRARKALPAPRARPLIVRTGAHHQSPLISGLRLGAPAAY